MSCSLLFSALLLMCCLLAARGDLTEADFAKISSIIAYNYANIDAKFDNIDAKFVGLKSDIDAKFDKIDAKFDKIDAKFDKIDAKFGSIDAKIDGLREITYEGFQRTYSFNREKLETLFVITGHAGHCGGSATQHTLLYLGKVASVFTPHISCTNSSVTSNSSYIYHDMYDLALDITCDPNTRFALDISRIVTPHLGDGLFAYGFGNDADVWQGIVARFESGKSCSAHPVKHWTGKTRVCNGEIMAQGHQHDGMSGAAVLNGCGYIGMAHCARTPSSSQLANFAGIIPAAAIQAFIAKHLSKLPTLETCKKGRISSPLAPHVNCSHATTATQTVCNSANLQYNKCNLSI